MNLSGFIDTKYYQYALHLTSEHQAIATELMQKIQADTHQQHD
jgi:hypothetical protein